MSSRSHGVSSDDAKELEKSVMPERNLWAAVLSRAICDALGSAQCDAITVRKARQWLYGQLTPSKPHSFAWVAHQLDLEPEALQKTIRSFEKDPNLLQERLGLFR